MDTETLVLQSGKKLMCLVEQFHEKFAFRYQMRHIWNDANAEKRGKNKRKKLKEKGKNSKGKRKIFKRKK